MNGRTHRSPRPARTPSGFTLLEVMVALGLLAGALMALAELSGQALRNHAYARDLSTATLLARGKMVELEQRYEDQGFRDFDEKDEGDFTDQGNPTFKWQVELKKPETSLSADGILAALTGSTDANDALSKLLGTQPTPGTDGKSTTTTQSPVAGLAAGLVQTQVTAFGEALKKSLREMRLTVSWRDGKVPRDVTVSTYLVVLNPRAPGGARGDNPDIPPNLVAPVAAGGAAGAAAAAAAAAAGATGATGATGAPAIPSFPQQSIGPGRTSVSPFVRPSRRNRPTE